MTVKELTDLLATYPPDAEVLAAWETTLNTITPAGVSLDRLKTEGDREIVVLDVDGGSGDGHSERVW